MLYKQTFADKKTPQKKPQTNTLFICIHAYIVCVCVHVCAHDTVSRDSQQPLAFYLLHVMNEGNVVSEAVVQAFSLLVEYDSCMQFRPPLSHSGHLTHNMRSAAADTEPVCD